MTMKSLTLAALAVLVACGDPVSPDPTPPLPAVAKIVYATDAALVFTSHVVPVRALVKAYDKDDNELPSSRLELTLPSGWQLRNDSIVAPTFEGNWRLKAKAKSTAALDETQVQDTSLVTAALDLREYDWTATFKCTQPANVKLVTAGESNAYVDSILVSAVVDSVTYAVDDAGVHLNYGGTASMWWHSTTHFYLRDSTDFIEESPVNSAQHTAIERQAPDSIVFNPLINRSQLETVTLSGNTYTGGSWCSSTYDPAAGMIRGPVTLTRTLKQP